MRIIAPKIKSLIFQHIRVAVLAAAIVAIMSVFTSTEKDRFIRLEETQAGRHIGDGALFDRGLSAFSLVVLGAAGLAIFISIFGPGLKKRLQRLDLPYVNKSKIMKRLQDYATVFEKDFNQISAQLEEASACLGKIGGRERELIAKVKSLERLERNQHVDFRNDPGPAFSDEFVLNLALCGEFPDLPGEVLSGDFIDAFPLENVGSSIRDADVDVVLVRDADVARGAKRIRKLGKPVLVVSDSRNARMAAYTAFKELALFYTPYERLGEPGALLEAAGWLDRVERATRFKSGEQRLITECPGILDIIEQFDMNFCGTLLNTSILLMGETGVGKELMAKLMAAMCKKHLEIVNSGELKDSLWKSQVFGHEKGAYTDAKEARKGALELAHLGVLFLDEVGDMPWGIQAAFLRILEQRIFKRLGDEKPKKTDFLLISATNKDLDAMVESGEFRRDLLWRIRGVEYVIPSLASRPFDIPLILHFFLGRLIGQTGKYVRLSKTFVENMQKYPHPGNVRLLNSLLTTAFFRAREGDIIQSIPVEISNAPPLTLNERLERVRRDETFKELIATNRDIKETAKRLDRSRKFVLETIKKHGL